MQRGFVQDLPCYVAYCGGGLERSMSLALKKVHLGGKGRHPKFKRTLF
jgi:hypothetical protein